MDAGARVLPRVPTGEADMGENAAATPAKARARIVRRICNVTRRCYSCYLPGNSLQEQDHDPGGARLSYYSLSTERMKYARTDT